MTVTFVRFNHQLNSAILIDSFILTGTFFLNICYENFVMQILVIVERVRPWYTELLKIKEIIQKCRLTMQTLQFHIITPEVMNRLEGYSATLLIIKYQQQTVAILTTPFKPILSDAFLNTVQWRSQSFLAGTDFKIQTKLVFFPMEHPVYLYAIKSYIFTFPTIYRPQKVPSYLQTSERFQISRRNIEDIISPHRYYLLTQLQYCGNFIERRQLHQFRIFNPPWGIQF